MCLFVAYRSFHYPAMSLPCGMGDIIAISGLALKVYTAYKEAPDNYRNISDEVNSLHIVIKKAAKHFESTSLSDSNWQEGQEVLKGCQNVLEDLDCLIEKYNSLASSSTSKAIQKIQLGAEDIATLRARITSNTTLLNGFIQRFDIPTIFIENIALISLCSCDSDKIQARLDSVLGLHRTRSRDSIVSFAASTNTKKTYKKFLKGLVNIGVTAEMISEKEKEIQGIFKPQNPATRNNIEDSTSTEQSDHSQLPEVGNSSDAETPPISPISLETIWTQNKPKSRSRFGWVRPQLDFLVGPLMLAAAEAGNTSRLISTLEYVRNINFADDQKETALHKAAARGYTDTVELLLSKGALIEAINSSSDTPLILAARNGYTSIMELLLLNGASGEAMDGDNSVLLHRATLSGYTRTVELLISKGASIEAMDGDRNTPLHCAAFNGHTSTVELLLSKGALIEAMDVDNNTPLHSAASNGHTTTVELLLAKGASTEAMGYLNKTPLHDAALYGHNSTMELLLAKGSSIEAMDESNHTPLHLAASGGQTSTVELLLSKGASIEAVDKGIGTPLHLAALRGHTSTVELLLSKGASIEAMDEGDCTPLHYAAWGGYASVVELLLLNGASMEALDCASDTPLHGAARRGHTSTVELLISKGASIEAMNYKNNTPLALATLHNHSDTAKLLNKAAELAILGKTICG